MPTAIQVAACNEPKEDRDLRSADVQKQTDQELYKWTADGKGKMPAYKAKLTAAEINALVAHMRTMAKK